jgi:sulfur carrier protein ThiS
LDGKTCVSDLLKETEPIYLKYADITDVIYPRAIINGEEVSADIEIKDGDQVELLNTYTLEGISARYEMDPLIWEFTVNGSSCDLRTVVKAGEQVVGMPKAAKAPALNEKDSIQSEECTPKTNSDAISMQSILKQVGQKLAARDGIMVKVNGKSIDLQPKSSNYMFVDIFNHIDFDLTTPKGVIMLKLNGKEANFTDVIKSGDVIDIYWGE